MNKETEIFFIVLIQIVMNLILLADLFGLEELGLNWVRIIVMVLWTISVGLAIYKISMGGNKNKNEK